MQQNLLSIALVTFLIQISFSQNLVLDNNFGTNGKVETSFGSDDSLIASLAIQSNGKILACGSYYNGTINQIALSRYNIDGSLDDSFGNNGKILTAIGTDYENEHNSVRVLNNGKILVAGTNGSSSANYDFAIVRYNEDGSLDSGFGNNGIVLSDFNCEYKLSALEIQNDNKIVVGGSVLINPSGNNPDFAIARYNDDGTKDLDFGLNGISIINMGTVSDNLTVSEDYIRSIKIQPDGKILASGLTNIIGAFAGRSNFGLVRLDMNGSLDDSFGNKGRVITDFGEAEEANTINVLSDGKIILSGIYYYNDNSNEKVVIAKYTADGILDNGYGINGKVITDFGKLSPVAFAFSSEIQKDGKLLVMGCIKNTTADFFILRYNIDGSLDTTFDLDGFLFIDFGENEGAYTSLIQPEGKLIFGGATQTSTGSVFTLLRFNEETLSLNQYTRLQYEVYPNPFAESVTINSKGTNLFDEVVELYDVCGKKLKSFVIGNTSSFTIPVDDNLSKGNYFLKIINERKSETFKIVKE